MQYVHVCCEAFKMYAQRLQGLVDSPVEVEVAVSDEVASAEIM